jgi:hypothetical protein
MCLLSVRRAPIGKLRYYKRVKGLSYERLGELMGRDPEQLTDWLSGRVRTCRRNIQSIFSFVSFARNVKRKRKMSSYILHKRRHEQSLSRAKVLCLLT